MSAATIRATNFRAIERLDWTPEGTCLLVGANGVGKTTILDMLVFLRSMFDRGIEAASRAADGAHRSCPYRTDGMGRAS